MKHNLLFAVDFSEPALEVGEILIDLLAHYRGVDPAQSSLFVRELYDGVYGYIPEVFEDLRDVGAHMDGSIYDQLAPILIHNAGDRMKNIVEVSYIETFDEIPELGLLETLCEITKFFFRDVLRRIVVTAILSTQPEEDSLDVPVLRGLNLAKSDHDADGNTLVFELEWFVPQEDGEDDLPDEEE